jgi:hypothetical protein
MKEVILSTMMLATLGACNQSTNDGSPNVTHAIAKAGLIELTTFKLKNGIATADFLKSAYQMQQDFLAKQNGFIKRSLTNEGDTLWTDIVYWENVAAQNNAMKLSETATEIIPFMQSIDFSTVKMKLTTPILTSE